MHIKHYLVLGAFATVAFFSSCAKLKSAYSTPEQQHAIAANLLADGKSVLGNVLTSALVNVAQQEIAGGKVDYAHAAAAATWSATNSGNLSKLINDATGGTVPQLAETAANIAAKAVAGGVSSSDALHAVASVISATAL